MSNTMVHIISHKFKTAKERDLFETLIAIERAKYGKWANELVEYIVPNDRTIKFQLVGTWKCFGQIRGSFNNLIEDIFPGSIQYGYFYDGWEESYRFYKDSYRTYKYRRLFFPQNFEKFLPPFRRWCPSGKCALQAIKFDRKIIEVD